MNRSDLTSSKSSLDIANSTSSSKRTGGIVSVEGCTISVADCGAREGTRGRRVVDLGEFLLPPTVIYPHPTSLGSRIDLVDGITAAVLALGRRTGVNSKDGARRIVTAIHSLAKFVEYGWLHGIYSWQDWSHVATNKLVTTLGVGGWTTALDLIGRSKFFLQTRPNEEVSTFIEANKSRNGGYSLKERFRIELGTNLRQTELTPAKLLVLRSLSIQDERTIAKPSTGRVRRKLKSYEAGMVAGQLCKDLATINLLAECGDHPPLRFVPFPETVKLSKQHGRAGGRTGNLTPDIVANLLKDAFWWMENCGDSLLATCDHIFSEFDKRMRAGKSIKSKNVFDALRAAPDFERLEEIIGVPITSVGLSWEEHDDGISFKQLIYSLATACFVTIAFVNARRKDELSHRKIGLHRRALRVVNRELRLYECDFFIQKSVKDYVPFYIGEITRTAVRTLERLSDIARALQQVQYKDAFIPEDAREDKLFQLPQFASQSESGGSQWYIFRSGVQGHSDYFIWRALKGNFIPIHPHMFRRAYALIHHYRFENATLQQLSQQLAHMDLAMTAVYVRDAGECEGGTPAIVYAEANRKAQSAAIDELKKEIAEVARERVRELVSQVIGDGPRASGGFARLIQRFHQRLGKRIEYQLLSHSAQSDMVSQSLVNHGHAFRPMRQANCVASPTRRSRSAKCYSDEVGGASRVLASANTCTDCPYSHWVEEHHAALDEDILVLEAEISLDNKSVKGKANAIELENLKRVLELRRKRLKSMGGKEQ